MIWYLFSLVIVVAVLLAWWAANSGAIDERGSFHGSAGKVLALLLSISLDIKESVLLTVGIAALVSVPQCLSYLLSGLSGCASTPMFLEGSATLLVWAVTKTLAVAGGVAIWLSLYGQYIGAWDLGRSAATAVFGLMMVLLAFSTLYFYRQASEFWSFVGDRCPSFRSWAQRGHAWFTRKALVAERVED